MKVVIMAGGKGTRIAPVRNNVPKPMIPVGGKPVLEHEIKCLVDQGYTDITLVVGHLRNVIQEYFDDGREFGAAISYFVEKESLGTGGALFQMKDALQDDFFLLNGDIMLDIDFKRMEKYHREKGGWATLFTHPNDHPQDSALIVADSEKRITKWLNKEDERTVYKNRVNAGIHVISPKLLKERNLSGRVDLDREILKPFVAMGKMYVYDSPEYVRDMGTPERYWRVCEDYKSGKIKSRNLRLKQKAVFMDRDGTINRHRGFLKNAADMSLIEGAAKAISLINQSGYLAIIVTNQPVIARGECTLVELEQIHNRMETLLGMEGAWIDDIFFCPHHPDKGFKGERLEYKFDCSCRKPKPGMLFQAAEKYNIDLSQSYMIGDSVNDVIAGNAAGCKSIYIGRGEIPQNTFAACNSMLEFAQSHFLRNG